MATKKIDPAKVAADLDALFSAKGAEIAGAIDALLEEEKEVQTKANERIAEIREQIKPLNDLYARATGKLYLSEPGPKKRGGAGKGELTGKALADMGNLVVAILQKRAGEWVSGKELAESIGYDKVAPAIAAATDGESVEKRGPGRAREYRMAK